MIYFMMMNRLFGRFLLVLSLCLFDRLLTTTSPLLLLGVVSSVSAFSSSSSSAVTKSYHHHAAFKTIPTGTTYHQQHHHHHQYRQILLLSSSSSSTTRRFHTSSSSTTTTFHTTTRLWMASTLPDGYEEYGTAIIRRAAQDCGSTNVDEDITIEWKPGKIIVTVNTQNAYLMASSSSSSSSSSDEDEDNNDLEFDDEDDDFLDNDEEDDMLPKTTTTTTEGDSGDSDNNDSISGGGIDVTKLARAINYGLDPDGDETSIGYKIAENHEIEVTTPIRSSSNAAVEIQGQIMFNAYKGFDVQCEFFQEDLKKTKKKIKTIDGRLHDRTSDFTIINIKGRMKKIHNNQIISVKLPKAKKEKGGG